MVAPTLSFNNGLDYQWAEFLGKSGGSATHSFNFGWGSASQSQMVVDCLWDDFARGNLLVSLLGAAWRESTSLKRQLPMAHPIFPHLYCSRVASAQGVSFTQKTEDAWGTFASYQLVRLGLVFEAPTFAMLDDAELAKDWEGKERNRFLEWQRMPTVESIQHAGSFFQWEEGGGSGPTIGKEVPFGVPHYLSKVGLQFTWKMVPVDYALDANYAATKIESCLGKLNKTPIWGCAAGTLYFAGMRLEKRGSPFLLPNVPTNYPQYLLDIPMQFKFFDPPKGGTVRGHNLSAWNDGLWYAMKCASNGNKRLYEEAEFNDIFTAT